MEENKPNHPSTAKKDTHSEMNAEEKKRVERKTMLELLTCVHISSCSSKTLPRVWRKTSCRLALTFKVSKRESLISSKRLFSRTRKRDRSPTLLRSFLALPNVILLKCIKLTKKPIRSKNQSKKTNF